MTVQELVETLKRFNGELRVEIETSEGDTIEDFIVEEAFGTMILKEF